MEGVQVGCFVKGGVRDVDKGGRKSSSKFKADLLGSVKLLVQEFEKLGVKDYQKIMSTTSPKQRTLLFYYGINNFLSIILWSNFVNFIN